MISGYAAVVGTISGLIFFATNLFLTIKLRPRKYEIMLKIAETAPEKIRSRALLMMEMHMSWVAGSAGSYIWFIYPMLRFIGRIPANEISKWQYEIKKVMGTMYRLYWLSIMLLNLTLASLAIFIINEYVIGLFI
ncbi:hypothetical protein NB466_22145 [Vibrio fluvialis]|uniref:hypothetical protein n=1 Tax=Vibrio TaxID=662 RepID=UPI001C9D1C34|nr:MULTISPECIES: hypothetical protein [Vibrio]ELP6738992.1 hypothetical protein [Vibrio vulnificus]EIZ1315924.1 hypothetical protein [Vibrio parahaemolyticus]EKF9857451.1 hypothetical protein [Vibrio cholerae]EKO5181741.1 hypothetical protein [Vibrio cholerae]ELL4669450.1 hypothetical protein [Vibrio fluvialis]